jgi:hypothetical protein
MNNNNHAAEDDTAAAFIPAPRSVEFNGAEIVIDTFDVLQTIRLIQQLKGVLVRVREGALPLDRIQALIGKIVDAPEEDEEASADFDLTAAEMELVISLLSEFAEPITELVAIAIRKPVAFVQSSKDFTGLIRLCIAIGKVNASFFGQQASALLADLRSVGATNPASGAGLTPSTASAASATH